MARGERRRDRQVAPLERLDDQRHNLMSVRDFGERVAIEIVVSVVRLGRVDRIGTGTDTDEGELGRYLGPVRSECPVRKGRCQAPGALKVMA